MIIELIARDEGGRLVCYPKRTRGRTEEIKRRQIEACRFLNGEIKKGETKVSPQIQLFDLDTNTNTKS